MCFSFCEYQLVWHKDGSEYHFSDPHTKVTCKRQSRWLSSTSLKCQDLIWHSLPFLLALKRETVFLLLRRTATWRHPGCWPWRTLSRTCRRSLMTSMTSSVFSCPPCPPNTSQSLSFRTLSRSPMSHPRDCEPTCAVPLVKSHRPSLKTMVSNAHFGVLCTLFTSTERTEIFYAKQFCWSWVLLEEKCWFWANFWVLLFLVPFAEKYCFMANFQSLISGASCRNCVLYYIHSFFFFFLIASPYTEILDCDEEVCVAR